MERMVEISYHIVRRTPNQYVIEGVDADGNRTGSKLFFGDGQDALQAYIDLNGFTNLKPEDILYYLESA